jgi:hypothetical protein
LRHAHGLTLYEPDDLFAELADLAVPGIADLREITAWAEEHLNAPHPDLGRRGPVCPFTRLSMDSNCFLLAWAGGDHDIRSIESAIDRYRQWFLELIGQSEKTHQRLLTILVVLPGLDRADADPLDALQERLKDAFVAEGLMAGQFHPQCTQSGLWNEEFKPLKAPIPLLAIRQMVASDLPFLLGSASHLSAYLDRFAPDIPGHVRRLLVAKITAPAGMASSSGRATS